MRILVDSSVWIDYFCSGEQSSHLDLLIDENLLAVNDIILAELVPFLKIRKQRKAIHLLNEVYRHPLQIDWEELIRFQVRCLQTGTNGIGLPDLIIAQNAKQNRSAIYSLDNHFRLLGPIIRVDLYPS